MLYIWPFFAFFSAPLLLPSLITHIETALQAVYKLLGRTTTTQSPQLFVLTQAFSKIYYIPYLLLTTLLGVDLTASAWAALIATIALLTIYSYVAGERGGLDMRERIACAAAGAGVGLLVVALKVALH